MAEHNHEEAGQVAFVYQLLQQRLEELNQQGSLIEKTYFEVMATKEGLSNLKAISNGSLLVPLGSGLYIQGRGIPDASDKVLVNVGSNIVVEKTQKETESMLDERAAELENALNQVATEMQKVSEQMNQIAHALQEHS